MPLLVGTKAPDFTLKTMTDSGLQDVSLHDYLGKQAIVLLFFPAAFTGVCTKEMCEVSAGLKNFADQDAVVFGISADTAFAQNAWAKQNNITVTLLSDYTRKVTQAYDVVLPDLSGLGPSAARAAFVIDRQGIIRYAERTPAPTDLPSFNAIEKTLQELRTASAMA